ncbi:MAG: hypothetical protein ABJN69_01000 [Hellea sp.]
MLNIQSLPAGEGDALWIEWGTEKTHRILIDMGRASHGRRIYNRIKKLPKSDREFELFILTHVDRDHIGGVLGGFVGKPDIPGLHFKDIWFNGWNHLHGLNISDDAPSRRAKYSRTRSHKIPKKTRSMQRAIGPAVGNMRGALQGEKFGEWLETNWLKKGGSWNKQFGGGPVVRPESTIPAPIILADGLSLTLLGPTQTILRDFIPDWAKEMQKAIANQRSDIPANAMRGLDGFDVWRNVNRKGRPKLTDKASLMALADKRTKIDHSGANGSSICILLEYQGKSALLTGDAHPDNLLKTLNLYSPGKPLSVDLVKLPHHGSEKNVTSELIEKLKSPRFLISTSGSYFGHPDPVAVARIIAKSSHDRPEVLFNVRSKFNDWWDNSDWKNEFSYETLYGDPETGINIVL